jgi:hypothetical protein
MRKDSHVKDCFGGEGHQGRAVKEVELNCSSEEARNSFHPDQGIVMSSYISVNPTLMEQSRTPG